jgi:hypothetical protein
MLRSKIAVKASRGVWIYIAIVFLCYSSCNGALQDETHDIEVINYFYETAFRTDGGRIFEEAYRWTGDIPISLHGVLWKNDSLFVLDAIQEINDLKLPIFLRLTQDSIESRLRIHFGRDNSTTDSINTRKIKDTLSVSTSISGDGLIRMSDAGEILFGDINIFNRSAVYDNVDSIQGSQFRKKVVLEEIYQSLGIVGDSFTHYNSTIYEGKNLTTSLSALDKEVLKFLYRGEGNGKRIKRRDFEAEYAAVLYNNLTAEKLKELSQEHGLDRDDLHLLVDMVFLGDSSRIFTKFPRDIFYKLEGTYTRAEVEFFEALVGELNNSIPTLNGEFTGENTYWNASPTLTVHMEHKEEVGEGATLKFTYWKDSGRWLYEYRLRGVATIKLYDLDPRHKNKLITFAVLRGLGLEITEGNVLQDSSLPNLSINEKYVAYLRFLYDPRFPSGISTSEYQRLLEEMT